jgi:anti-anti-sigma factor
MSSVISGLLKSEKRDDQLRGLQLLLQNPDAEQLPLVLKLSKLADPDLSKLAGMASLQLSKSAILERGRKVSAPVIKTAVSLIKTQAPDFIKSLLAQIEDINVETVVSAMMAVRYFISIDKAEEFLRRFSKIPANKVRATLVRHIGSVAAERSPEMLNRFLDDADPRVRANTIEMMEQVGNKHYQRIMARFRGDAHHRIRANAVKAAFSMGDRTYLKSLEEMLAQYDKPAMQISAVWVIGEIGSVSKDSLGLLKLVVESKNEAIRAQLKKVLEKVGMVPELEYLRGFIKEDIKNQIKSNIIRNTGLKIESHQKPKYLVFVLWGSLTVETMLSLRFSIEDLEKKGGAKIALDFERVEYVDSTGAALLTNFSKALEKKGGFLFIFGCNERIRELFQIIGLDLILKLFTNEQDVENYLP